MAGSPLKRQRQLGVRADKGSVIAFPYMPRVADLPRGWQHWSPAQKTEHLLGMSLDPPRLSLWAQVWRVIFMLGAKALLDGKLGREAARELPIRAGSTF
jgi:hypothetical protein